MDRVLSPVKRKNLILPYQVPHGIKTWRELVNVKMAER
jgi:hypothetical protein